MTVLGHTDAVTTETAATAMPQGLHEECGVVGVYGSENAAMLLYYGLHALQHRGQEGAGIAVSNGTEMKVKKAKGLISQVFADRRTLDKLVGPLGIGHVRYATSGNNWTCNVQPFVFHLHDANFALAHNGNLVNSQTLKRELEGKGAIFFSNSDSEVLMHLIRRAPGNDFVACLKHALTQIRGAFSYVLMTDDTLYGVVDPHGLRPLIVGTLPDGGYMIASETCALDLVGATFHSNITGGQIVSIGPNGVHIERYAEQMPGAVVAMEYIYFSRPDSDILGRNVHAVRKQCGALLAKESPADADIVIGVPNSSLSAASGYAEAAGLPYEMGLIKNQYTSRTFIQPTQALREHGVRMKLSAVRSIVQDKRVVLVDDSIVRGTTSLRIVNMLRDFGASEVHLRIASPPFRFPTFYGIDAGTSAELIAANLRLPDLCKHLNADSLEYLSVESLVKAVGLHGDGPYGGLCMDSFTGHYPAGLGDYRAEFEASLTDIQREYLAEQGIEI